MLRVLVERAQWVQEGAVALSEKEGLGEEPEGEKKKLGGGEVERGREREFEKG